MIALGYSAAYTVPLAANTDERVPVSSTLPARTTDEQFEAIEVLRTTATSTLFAGRHLRMGFDVALKVPKGKQARSVARRELIALRDLHHPNNVRLLGAAQLELDSRKHPCLVLSLHRGRTLRELLRVQRRLSAIRAIELVRQVLGALEEAHGRGIAHGDVQPANVMIESAAGLAERVVLVDYSAASSREIESTERGRQTVYGTPFYTAPEVGIEGGPTVQSDVYSAGILLYEMLSGARPPRTDASGDASPWRRQVPPLRDALPGNYQLGEVVDRAIANHPSERFPSAAAFAVALSRLDLARLAECDLVTDEPTVVAGAEADTVEIEIPEGERYLDLAASPNESKPEPFPLQSAGLPTIWVLDGDPAVDRPEVREALQLIATVSEVTRLNADARARRVTELRDQDSRVPWVVVFGQSHLKCQDALVGWLAEHRSEISRMLISDSDDLAALQQAIDCCGLDHHTKVPSSSRTVALDVRQMVERARALRLHYDSLRIGWRDARDDLHNLTAESLGPAAR